MAPVWWAAGRRLKTELGPRQVPLLGLGAAFGFTLMMFNIPMPGGTTVHCTGAVLLAVLLGPWAAAMGMSAALAIQALFFGDGGVLAFGANAFAMAFVSPFAGYGAYRLVAALGRRPAQRALAAGIGAWVGANAGAFVTALVLGIQPLLFHDAAGRSLYFPFDLSVTVPALMLAHLTVAGVAEGIVTALAVRYAEAAGIRLAGASDPSDARAAALDWALVGLGVAIALSPLGLVAKGEAWGEWSLQEIAARASYAPSGMATAEGKGWRGFNILPDYLSGRGAIAYVISGAVGALMVGLLLLAIVWLLGRRGGKRPGGPPTGGGYTSALSPGEVPSWMVEPPRSEPPESSGASARGWRPRGFIARTLAALGEAFRASYVAEAWARQPGLLQAMDPRAKTITLLAFVVVVTLLRNPLPILALGAVGVGLAAASRLPLVTFLARTWLGVPLAIGAVTLPATLNILTPGRPVLLLSRNPDLAVTWEGLGLAGILVGRIGTALGFAVLLAATTPWADLLAALRALRVPRSFVAVVSVTYRYIAVLVQAATEALEARRSRRVGAARLAAEQGFVGRVLGAIFGKAHAMSEEVFAAMAARGFSGEPASSRRFALEPRDLGMAAGLLTVALAALGLDLLL
jgi:cobalt/nickel transport system permease protein